MTDILPEVVLGWPLLGITAVGWLALFGLAWLADIEWDSRRDA